MTASRSDRGLMPRTGAAPVTVTARSSRAALLTWAGVCAPPGLTALGLGCWQLSARSFTQDEAATLSATRRPLSALMRMLSHIDAVHGVYYALIHCVVVVAGASEADVRFPSVAATAVAAAALAGLGARLGGRRAGLAAGLLYAVSPPATEYAQMARPYALATALAVIAVDRFVVFAGTGTRRSAAAYAAALTAAGWVNVLTLLVAVAGALSAAWVPAWRPRLPRLAAATAATGVAVLPLIWLGLSQIGQIGWEHPPTAGDLLTLLALLTLAAALTATSLWPHEPGPSATLTFALRARVARGPAVLTPIVLRADARRGRAAPATVLAPDSRRGPSALAAVAAPWLILPPVVLAAVSQVSPMWEPRYLLFCLPALALLTVAAASRLPARGPAAAVTVAVACALAAQPLIRPAVAADDLRAVSRMLAARARPGDAVVFPDIGRRLIKDAYPAGFAHLHDVGLDTSPAHRDSLYGLNVGQSVLQRRLADVNRLWVIRYSTPHPGRFYGTAFGPREFCASRTWQFPGSTVTLYFRCATAGLSRR